MKFKLKEMDNMEMLKNNLYSIATADQKKDMDEIFQMEVEIPPSGQFDLDSDPDWFDINDYISE